MKTPPLARDPRAACALCAEVGGVPVAATEHWRAIRVEDAAFPAFYRLVWREHVAEFGDLPPAERRALLDAVVAVEQVLRTSLAPTKINLASLGNVVPHVHWHVIARFDWDSHWPQPVWGVAQRVVEPAALGRLAVGLDVLDARVAAALAAFGAH